MKKQDGFARAPTTGVLLFQICNQKSREPYAEFYDFSTTMHQEEEVYQELSRQVQKFTALNLAHGTIVINPSIFPELSWGIMAHKYNWIFIGKLISFVRIESRKDCHRSIVQESQQLLGRVRGFGETA